MSPRAALALLGLMSAWLSVFPTRKRLLLLISIFLYCSTVIFTVYNNIINNILKGHQILKDSINLL